MDPRSEVILRQLDSFHGSVLVAGLPADHLAATLQEQVDSLIGWVWHFDDYHYLHQQYPELVHFSAEPPTNMAGQRYDQVIVFLPKSKELTEYLLHRAASHLNANGHLFLVGEKRAGIERAAKQLQPYGKTLKLDSARHCQLWQCSLSQEVKDKPLQQWAKTATLDGAQPLKWVSLPGVFSHGRLDQGTALLLSHLDKLPKGDLLDFGCGAGIVGIYLKQKYPQQTVHFLDVDAFALAATRMSLQANGLQEGQGINLIAGRGISDAPQKLAAIISNPPFHQGIHTQYQVSEELLNQAVHHLNPYGEIRIVANSFLKYPPLIQARFGHCNTLGQANGFHVYQAKTR